MKNRFERTRRVLSLAFGCALFAACTRDATSVHEVVRQSTRIEQAQPLATDAELARAATRHSANARIW